MLPAVFADGETVLPAETFRTKKDLALQNGLVFVNVRQLASSSCRVFWRSGKAFFDRTIFQRWVEKFIPDPRSLVLEYAWMVVFYGALRAQMTFSVIELFHDNKMP